MGSVENLDKHTISKVFEKLGYVHPLTQLKELEKYSYKGNDLFLMTFQSELFNLYNNGTSLNSSSLLSIKGLITLEDYLKLKKHYRGNHVTISPNCKLGFVNGKCEPISSFGITLNKIIPFSCRGDNIGLMKILSFSSINELEGCKIEVN